jgi:hypothetical protein
MESGLVLLRLMRDLLFMAGGGWIMICLSVGLGWAIAGRLIRLIRHVARRTAAIFQKELSRT